MKPSNTLALTRSGVLDEKFRQKDLQLYNPSAFLPLSIFLLNRNLPISDI